MNDIENILVNHIAELQRIIESEGYEVTQFVSNTKESANLGNGVYVYNLGLVVKKTF